MATFISLVNWTEQGIRNVKVSPDRYEAFKAVAEKTKVKIKGFYYTMGRCDMVLITEASDEAAMSAMLKLCSLGNLRTETMLSFSVDEMRKLIGKMP
jgi:uncharacterized protein with GYD domain